VRGCASVPLDLAAIEQLKNDFNFNYAVGSYTAQIAEGELE
jgi:hypothetical protein